MLYTLTPNPAIDMNIETVGGALVPDSVNRVGEGDFSPNGKGVNVSFVLAHFGRPTSILGFFGGFTGRYIVDGARGRCDVKPLWVEGNTRVTVLLRAGDVEYTMPGSGTPVPPASQDEMLDLIAGLEDLDGLVVSGSLPPLVGPEYLDRVMDVMDEKGAPCILDVSSSHLAHLVERRPLLIKPNDDELKAVFGLEVTDDGSAVAALREVCARGARNVLLTMGGSGAYFCDGQSVWHATAPAIEVFQTACAGDASLGAFLSVWFEDRDAVEAALTRAMACGADAAMSPGLGELGRVDSLAAQVQVRRVA